MFGQDDLFSDKASGRRRSLVGRLGVEVRPGEGWIAVLLFLCFFLFITFQYVTKSVRQSTFIDSLGASQLPYVYLAVAVCSYPAILLYSWLVDRIWRYHLIAGTCGMIGASLVGFWWVYGYPWNWVPVVFYVWASIVFVMTVSQFWNFANHVLNPRQAKRLFGFIGAGGLLGGMAGGQIARGATALIGTRHTLLVAAFILVVTMMLVLLISHTQRGERGAMSQRMAWHARDPARGGFQALRSSRHLQLIGGLLLLTVMVAQVVDLQFNWAVEQSTTDLDERNAFFGNFYTVMGAAALLFQLVFTSRIHRFLGVGFGMRVLPVTMALGTATLFLAAGFFPALMITAALTMKIGENGLRYSLDQATRELLFLPTPSRLRLKAKTYIDVFVQRAAKGLAALLLLPVTFGAISVVGAGWISLVLIVAWLAVTVAVVRAYRREFRRHLKYRPADMAVPIDLSDAHALELVVESLDSGDSRRIVHGMELLSSHGRANLIPASFLGHADPEVCTKTLDIFERYGRHDAVPQITRLVDCENSEIRARAIRVLTLLREVDPQVVARRREDTNPGVQAAAGAYLAEAHGEDESRAMAALRKMVRSEDPLVRLEAARSLGAIRDPKLDGDVLRLLEDPDPEVLRTAIASVCCRVAHHGFSPLYVPRLVSLLRDRRFKGEARDALVASGEPVILPLVHFMFDPDESITVRRALPRTIARIGGPRAWNALIDALRFSDDPFLRRNVIQALVWRDATVTVAKARSRIVDEIMIEAQSYLEDLANLDVLGLDRLGNLTSAGVRWDATQRPSLLHRLLAERMQYHQDNIFCLLQLIHVPRQIRASYDGLKSEVTGPRSHALEYLDISLAPNLKRSVLAVIDQSSTDDKLRKARKEFGVTRQTSTDTLEMLLRGLGHHREDSSLKAAATQYVHDNRIKKLLPRLQELCSTAESGLVRETALVALKRWDQPPGMPAARWSSPG